jgi:hypothetical protein
MMTFYLKNRGGDLVGKVIVTSSEGTLMLGTFEAAPHYRSYEQLFKEFEQAANDQLFIEIDRLEGEIAELGFYATGPFPQENRCEIEDLQIMGSGASFRLKR